MSKRINTYHNWTASELKSRATIPLATDIAVGATYIDCDNIAISKIRTTLGVSNGSISELWQHANVNRHSNFSPTRRYLNSGVLTYTYKSTYSFGDWAGYNHSASAPSFVDKQIAVNAQQGAESIPITLGIDIGEVKFSDIEGHTDISGIAFVLYDGATIVGYEIVALSGVKNTVDFNDCTYDIASPGLQANKTLNAKIYLVNISSGTFSESNVACEIPQLAGYSILVTMLPLTELVVQGTPFTITGETFIRTTGQTGCTGATYGNNISLLVVRIELYSYISDTIVDQTELYNAAYTANTNLTSLMGYLTDGSLPIDQYGYQARLIFEESS